MLVMVMVVLATTLAGVISNTMHSVVTYVAVIPAIASALFPWRPSWSLGLGLMSVAAPLAIVPDDIAVPLELYVLMGATYTAIAAAANQAHRRLWLELEITRRGLVAVDRLSTLGRAAAGVAHELKTPTAAALNSFAVIDRLAIELHDSAGHREVTDEDLRELAAEVRENSRLGTGAMRRAGRFLQAIRGQTLGMDHSEVVEFDVRGQIENALLLLTHRARAGSLKLDSAVEAATRMYGDPSKFGQVVTNLVSNALDACIDAKKGSSVRVTAADRDGGLLLVVEDDGPGVPAALETTLFEPLVTTKAGNGGTGLGLSICRDLVEGNFGGTIRHVESETGARFEARFPLNAARPVKRTSFVPGSHQPREAGGKQLAARGESAARSEGVLP
jgi:signal transduction histidine kinase